jgi:chromosome segregation ATPase
VSKPVVSELERQVIKAEETLRVKEEENLMLRQAMKQYEQRWEDYEAKMKEMEHTWKKQLTSLQVIFLAFFSLPSSSLICTCTTYSFH